MILIVGGGIGGLSLAACLARRGVEAEVIERQVTWTTVGGGITLYPNGMRALEAVGAREEVEEHGLALDRIRILGGDGRVLAEAPGDVWGGVGRTFLVDRRVLQRALLRASAGVPIRLGTTVDGIEVAGDRATVAFSDGTANRYDLVVGADGIYSTVRRMAFGRASLRYVGQMYWRTSATMDIVDTPTMMFDRDRYVVVFPLGGGKTYVAFQVRTSDPLSDDEGRVEALFDRFADFGDPAPTALEALARDPGLHFGPAEEIRDHRWHAGPVALIGDAAHACSPTMAQGGSLAIEDGVVLAEELAGQPAVEAAVTAFVGRRAPRVAWVRDRTHAEIEMLNAGAAHLAERSRHTEAVLGAPI